MADLVLDLNMLMFIDEAVKNDHTTGWPKGWTLGGRGCIQRQAFICRKCYSILPVITLDSIVVHNIVEGSSTSSSFLRSMW
jgi:hypothetical protein